MDQNKSEAPAKKNSFWLDFGPLLIFFGAFHYLKRDYPDDAMIYAAGILTVAATLALIYAWVRHRHTSPILIFSTVVIGLFALAAFIFDNENIVKIKPTVMNIIFGVAVLGGVFFKKNVIKMLMGSAFELPDDKWNVLAIRWGIFFFALAAINEVVWRHFSTEFWIGFKTFGFLPITLIFTLSQVPFLTKYGTMREG